MTAFLFRIAASKSVTLAKKEQHPLWVLFFFAL
jgi:hypothetical protein